MKKRKDIKNELLQFINKLDIVDQHEHLSEVLFKEKILEIDLPYFLAVSYLRSDLVTSGLPESFYKPSSFRHLKWMDVPPRYERFSYLYEGKDESEKNWNEIKPYLKKVKNTMYYRYLISALHDFYGFEKEDFDQDWEDLSEKIREKSKNNPNWTLKLLEKMGISKAILDIGSTGLPSDSIVDSERLAQVARMDGLIMGEKEILKKFREDSVNTIEEYIDVLDVAFQKSKKGGAIGVKSALAYYRIIKYNRTLKVKVEKILDRGLDKVTAEEKRIFQDFMMHEVCKKCDEYKFPFQIHTGMHAANYNVIQNSNPIYLTNLIKKYEDVTFDIFHGGYPYWREAGILAKYYPNAYVDGCWLNLISPSAYKQALNEWLDLVPATKIFGWGGDCRIPEHTYASLNLAKNLIAEVLALKISSGRFSKKTAFWVAERILKKNALEVFNF